MALLKKICLVASAAITCAFAGQAFADDEVIPLTTEYANAVNAAANDLVNYINNKPTKIATVELQGDLVYPADNNYITVTNSNPELINIIELGKLTFKAHVNSIIPTDVTVTVKIEGTVSADCSAVTLNSEPTIVSFAPYNPLLKSALLSDLKEDGAQMLEAMVKNGFNNFCPKK
jgi:hypothetical protein